MMDLPAVAWEILEAAELYRKGLPPAAGGQLDQAKAFVEAARFCWQTRAALKTWPGFEE